jgi:hypothetical protein
MPERRLTSPLALSDEQLRILREYAKPLLPAVRGAFLQKVAQLLREEREVGDGVISRCCRVAQLEFLTRAPAIDGTRA